MAVCSQCGFESPEGFKFCGGCGNSLEPERRQKQVATVHRRRKGDKPLSDTRRTVTILFSDVKGFTAMSESLDPETVHGIMDEYFQAVSNVIKGYGGTIDKYIGDAVMAVFGAPLAHGDDPERAVRAAIRMRGLVAEYAEQLQEEHGLSIGTRIGVNTGRVIWGGLGKGAVAGNVTVVGDAVNLASRLESAAPVGGILIGESTYRHVKGRFDVESLEPIKVKGKAQPVRVFLVHGEHTRPVARATMAGPPTPFVGRTEEIQMLSDGIDTIRETGEAASVTFVAAAGAGKSRLLTEFRDHVDEEGFRLLLARAPAFGQGASWSPWTSMFSRVGNLKRDDDRSTQRARLDEWVSTTMPAGSDERIGSYAPFVRYLVDVDPADDPVLSALRGSPKKLRAALEAAMVTFFEDLAAKRPTVLIAEDLQWWPQSSIDLLVAIANTPARLLIVATARPELAADNWPPHGESHSRRDLEPLGAREIAVIANGVLGSEFTLPESLGERITELSGGNPFFAEEIVQSLIDQKVLKPRGNSWAVDDAALQAVVLPESVEGVLQARLDELPLDEQRVLHKAAAAGQVFWDGLLTGGMEEETQEAKDNLLRLAAKDFVYPRRRSRFAGQREYAFKHALVREVAYENTLLRDRKLYHYAIARWITEVTDERIDAFAEDLAEHYVKAERMKDAIPHLVTAGESAFEANANRTVSLHLDRAIEFLRGEHEDELELRARLTRGRMRRLLGDIEQAVDDLEAGLEVAARLGRTAEVAAIHIEVAGSVYQRADMEKVEKHARAALEAARESGAKTRESTALNLLGIVALRAGDIDTAVGHFSDARTSDLANDNPAGAAGRLINIASARIRQNDYDAAISRLQEALAEPLRKESVPIALSNLGLAMLLNGDVAAATDPLERGLEAGRLIEHRFIISEISVRLGAARAMSGDDSGLSTLEDGLTMAAGIGAREQHAEAYWLRARVHESRGDGAAARADLEQCRELATEHNLETLLRRAEEGLSRLDTAAEAG